MNRTEELKRVLQHIGKLESSMNFGTFSLEERKKLKMLETRANELRDQIETEEVLARSRPKPKPKDDTNDFVVL